MKLNVDLTALHQCADAMQTGPDKSDSDETCPICDDWGYLYEGGMSLNPCIDNKTSCPRCNPDPDTEPP